MDVYGITEADETHKNNLHLAKKNFEEKLAQYHLGQETYGVMEMYRRAYQKLENESLKDQPWTCYCVPASTGRRCLHNNPGHKVYGDIVCCDKCGCTKCASDLRKKSIDRGEKL